MRLADRRVSLFKAISWRGLGTLDTFVVSWIVTGSPVLAGSISAVEVVSKVALYYLHERAWTLLTREESP